MKHVGFLVMLFCVGCFKSVVPDHLYYIHDSKFDDIVSYTVGIKHSPKQGNRCSGVIVKNTEETVYVLTAAHCIEDSKTKKQKEIVYVQYMNNRKIQMMLVDKYNRFDDLALLKSLRQPLEQFASVPISDNVPNIGDEIWTINNKFSLASGKISKSKIKCTLCGAVCIELFSSTDFGYSGGGVFNSNLELVGIISEFDQDNGETHAIHQITIFKFLKGRI